MADQPQNKTGEKPGERKPQLASVSDPQYRWWKAQKDRRRKDEPQS